MPRNNKRRCLNCGEKATGAFCPRCGQPTSTARLATLPFLTQTLTNLLRVNRGFAFTAWRLISKPWVVISDYIKCRRISYTPPVQMLIVLCLIAVVLDGLIGADTADSNLDTFEVMKSGTALARAVNSAFRLYASSPTLEYLTAFLPCTLAVRIAYRRRGASRFNTAEYLAATIYMTDTVIAVGIITSLIDFIMPVASTLISFLYTSCLVIVSLVKAFPCGSALKNALHILGFLGLSMLFYIAVLLPLGLLMVSA